MDRKCREAAENEVAVLLGEEAPYPTREQVGKALAGAKVQSMDLDAAIAALGRKRW